MAIGKVGSNGTLNENGAFYSVQDVNTLLETAGIELPEPKVADAGKAVIVDEEGKYALGEAGADLPTPTVSDSGKAVVVDEEGKYALGEAGADLPTPTVADSGKAVVVDAEGKYALGEGGSGSSLLNRTISVTFTNTNTDGSSAYYVNLMGCTLDENNRYILMNALSVTSASPKTVKMIASETGVIIGITQLIFQHIDDSVMPTVTGDATLDMQTGNIIITGTCTITCKSSSN